MLTRPLGKTGLAVPALGLGAGRLGEACLTQGEADRLIAGALDLGVVLFDAARGYGLAEERLGHALARHRDRVVLSTKVGYGIPGLADWTGPCVEAGVDAALARFRADRLDLVHLHSCDAGVLRRGEVVEALARAVAAGKVRVAAYSGEGEALGVAIRSGAFGAVQCSMNVLDQANAPAVAAASRDGLGVLAKRPLADAPWRFRARPPEQDLAAYWDRFRALGLAAGDPALADTFLRFAAFTPGVSAALVGTASLCHLEAASRAVERGPLPEELRRGLEATFTGMGAGWPGLV